MLVHLALMAPALAGPPRFHADQLRHVGVAWRAWELAVECTGWEASAHDTVEIRERFVPGVYGGRAFLDDEGLFLVELAPGMHDNVLVHEIAHAWVHDGPPGLMEGRTQLLADCIVSRDPRLGTLAWDSGRDLDDMPDLLTWSNPTSDHRCSILDEVRADAYLGANRLARVLSTVLGPEQLWPRAGYLSWDRLRHELHGAGPRGRAIAAMLDGGVESQRSGLSDLDRDGLPRLTEELLGTDPLRRDSFGDGWWDGAQRIPGGLPLPADGTPVCAGIAPDAAPADLQLVVHDLTRSGHAPVVVVRDGARVLWRGTSGVVTIPPHASPLLQLRRPLGHTTGGVHVQLEGSPRVAETRCRSTPTFTVWAADHLAAPWLTSFSKELAARISRVEALLGAPAARRLVAVLGARDTRVRDGAIHLSSALVDWARTTGSGDALAAVTVALHRLWHQPDVDLRRLDAAEAMATSLLDAPLETRIVAPDEVAVAAWLDAAWSCPGGWIGILEGACRRP